MGQGLPVYQQPPTFLAPGTNFMEDNFSVDRSVRDGFRMIEGNFTQAHLLLCHLVPNRPILVTGLCMGGWGPLLYTISNVWHPG